MMELKIKIIKKRTQKHNWSQPRLTHQTRDPGHETWIISQIVNKKTKQVILG
jgi:hypothetical protein